MKLNKCFCPHCGSNFKAALDANAMAEELRRSIGSMFPDSYLESAFSTNIHPGIMIRFAFGKDRSEWKNGIVQNDPGFLILSIDGFDKQGNLSPKQQLRPLTNNSHRDLKLTGKTGTADQIVKHIVNYFKKLKDMRNTKENANQMIAR